MKPANFEYGKVSFIYFYPRSLQLNPTTTVHPIYYIIFNILQHGKNTLIP